MVYLHNCRNIFMRRFQETHVKQAHFNVLLFLCTPVPRIQFGNEFCLLFWNGILRIVGIVAISSRIWMWSNLEIPYRLRLVCLHNAFVKELYATSAHVLKEDSQVALMIDHWLKLDTVTMQSKSDYVLWKCRVYQLWFLCIEILEPRTNRHVWTFYQFSKLVPPPSMVNFWILISSH